MEVQPGRSSTFKCKTRLGEMPSFSKRIGRVFRLSGNKICITVGRRAEDLLVGYNRVARKAFHGEHLVPGSPPQRENRKRQGEDQIDERLPVKIRRIQDPKEATYQGVKLDSMDPDIEFTGY